MNFLKQIKTQEVTFKRRSLINSRLEFLFTLFVLLSITVVLYFMIEDYKYSLSNQIIYSSLNAKQKPSLFVILSNPISLIVLGIWGLASTFFAMMFKDRIKPMFRMFFWISFAVVAIYNLWIFFLSFALKSNNDQIIKFIAMMNYSPSTKVLLLLSWGFFSIYLSFSYINTKFNGIFERLDYLFKSIQRGNWDSIMFFRSYDSFSFTAKSFNLLKDKYVDELNTMEEQLIQIKDYLNSDLDQEKIKEKAIKIIQKNSLSVSDS